MKKKKIFIIITILVILSIIGTVLTYTLNTRKMNNNINYTNTGSTTYIKGKYSDVVINDSNSAKNSIKDIQGDLNIDSVENELETTHKDTSDENTNYYYYSQKYNGLDVYNSGMIVYADKQGNARGIVNNYKKIENFNIVPKNTADDLKEVIKNDGKYNVDDIKKAQLIIYPLDKNQFTLAYKYEINNGLSNDTIIVSDSEEKIIDRLSSVATVNYSSDAVNLDKMLINGKYQLQDSDRNINVYYQTTETECELYEFEENELNDKKNKLNITTLNNAIKTYDYFVKKFEYKSIDNTDETEIMIVTGALCGPGPEYKKNFKKNAYNIKNAIVFSSDNYFNDDLEILAHEYTHGVFYYKVGEIGEKNYEGKSINEAYADILGMCVESEYNNTSRIDGIIHDNLRKIKDSKVSFNDLPKTYDNYKEGKKDEHYYSQIISRAAYYMSGILSKEEFEQLWFRSLNLLPANPTMYDCYYSIMIEAELMGLSTKKQDNIKSSFASVGILLTDEIQKNVKEYTKNIENDKQTAENENGFDIVGTWKATGTDSNKYSLGWIYGTSVTYQNELKFNDNGTYMLNLGMTYYQEGRYKFEENYKDGAKKNTILLIDNVYKGDSPDYKMASKLIIESEGNKQEIILKETESGTDVNIIFENKKNIKDNSKDNLKDTTSNTQSNSTTNSTTSTDKPNTNNTVSEEPKELTIGKNTIKFGTYNGDVAATGDVLVIKSDGTATLNGTNYTYKVEKYNFAQDSSGDSYEDAIIFKIGNGGIAFALYVGSDGNLWSEPMCYVYSGK